MIIFVAKIMIKNAIGSKSRRIFKERQYRNQKKLAHTMRTNLLRHIKTPKSLQQFHLQGLNHIDGHLVEVVLRVPAPLVAGAAVVHPLNRINLSAFRCIPLTKKTNSGDDFATLFIQFRCQSSDHEPSVSSFQSWSPPLGQGPDLS